MNFVLTLKRIHGFKSPVLPSSLSAVPLLMFSIVCVVWYTLCRYSSNAAIW